MGSELWLEILSVIVGWKLNRQNPKKNTDASPERVIRWKQDCWSRKGKLKNKPSKILSLNNCDWLALLLIVIPIVQFSHDGKRRTRKRSRKKMNRFWFFRLPFRRTFYLRFLCSIFTRSWAFLRPQTWVCQRENQPQTVPSKRSYLRSDSFT